MPPEPADPVIDLAGVTEHRIEHAILKSFSPLGVDRALRETPEKFEWFRANYHHPREFAAYTVKNATTEERELFDICDNSAL